MKHKLLFVGLMASALNLFTGCSARSSISGTYTTTVDARSKSGACWRGTAEVLLTQNGPSLTGNLTLHHPTAGLFQIPITAGAVQEGKVVFFGHATLPLGTVELSFHGVRKGNHIEGTADVHVQSLFGAETDNATFLLVKA